LKELAERAGKAPSINNSQPWKFLAVKNKELLKQAGEIVSNKLKELFPNEGDEKSAEVRLTVEKFSTLFVDAPALIVVLNKPYEAIIDRILESSYSHEQINTLRNHPNIQTIGAAIENILLSAVELGYGACWLTGLLVAREELENLFGIKAPFNLAACVAVGKHSENIQPRKKKTLDEIFEIIH